MNNCLIFAFPGILLFFLAVSSAATATGAISSSTTLDAEFNFTITDESNATLPTESNESASITKIPSTTTLTPEATTKIGDFVRRLFGIEKTDAKSIISSFDFKKIEELCRTGAGLNRGRSIANSVISASKNPGNLQDILGIVRQGGNAVLEQDACGILGQLGRGAEEPKGLLTSLLSPVLNLFKTGG